jgi:hypothetical protein
MSGSDANEQENSNAKGQLHWEFTCLSPLPRTKIRHCRCSRGSDAQSESDWQFTCLSPLPRAKVRNGRLSRVLEQEACYPLAGSAWLAIRGVKYLLPWRLTLVGFPTRETCSSSRDLLSNLWSPAFGAGSRNSHPPGRCAARKSHGEQRALVRLARHRDVATHHLRKLTQRGARKIPELSIFTGHRIDLDRSAIR